MEELTMKVGPVEGRRVMFHDAPSRAITEERVVPRHPHYIRAVNRGDLVEIVETKPAKTKKEA